MDPRVAESFERIRVFTSRGRSYVAGSGNPVAILAGVVIAVVLILLAIVLLIPIAVLAALIALGTALGRGLRRLLGGDGPAAPSRVRDGRQNVRVIDRSKRETMGRP